MLNKTVLYDRRVFELSFKDCWEPAVGDVNGKDGFLQISLTKPENERVQINDDQFTLSYYATIKALVRNEENLDSDDVEDAVLLATIDVNFNMAYKHSLETGVVEQLVKDEYWFFQRDARLFLNEVASNVIANSTHDYIRLPMV